MKAMNEGFEIKIKNLSKSFDLVPVLKNIDLVINKGESVVILGQSGAGKSVFLKILDMVIQADSGSIKYDEKEIVGISRVDEYKLREKIGFLFQNCGLFDDYSVIENVCFYELFVKRVKDKDSIVKIGKEKLISLGIKESSFDLSPDKISGGMQKRVAIARILMRNPKLILLDEPTSGLDPIISDLVNETIVKMREISSATIITITHDLYSAMKIADRILVLKDGNFIWSGKPEKILESNDEYIKSFIESSNVRKYATK